MEDEAVEDTDEVLLTDRKGQRLNLCGGHMHSGSVLETETRFAFTKQVNEVQTQS